MLQYAFKEWAIICEALAAGHQSIILRKGGIDENAGIFQVEHSTFWLYPTFVHQQTVGVNDNLRLLLPKVETTKPPQGVLRLQHWADVTATYRLRDVVSVLLLSHLHGWSEEAVRKRFEYKMPGLTLLAVRVHRAPTLHEVPALPAYDGCRSWVELDRPLPTEGSTPVLDDAAYRIVQEQLDLLLRPTALA